MTRSEVRRTDLCTTKHDIHVRVAHQQAWEKAKVLHRDINDGNIIIDDTTSPWTARLIDWEQAKFLEDLNQGATNVIRSVRSFVFCLDRCRMSNILALLGNLGLSVGSCDFISAKEVRVS